MNFPNWYKEQGYEALDASHQGAGVNLCAEHLGLTPHRVRGLINGGTPSGSVRVLMGMLAEKNNENN